MQAQDSAIYQWCADANERPFRGPLSRCHADEGESKIDCRTSLLGIILKIREYCLVTEIDFTCEGDKDQVQLGVRQLVRIPQPCPASELVKYPAPRWVCWRR